MNKIWDCFSIVINQLGLINYKITEDVRVRDGRDNQFTVSCVLKNFPGGKQFANTFLEALVTLRYTDVLVIKNELITYEVSSEYAYAPPSGYH